MLVQLKWLTQLQNLKKIKFHLLITMEILKNFLQKPFKNECSFLQIPVLLHLCNK